MNQPINPPQNTHPKGPSAASALYIILLLTTTTSADTWNSFRGNPQLTGLATSKLPTPLDLLWTFTAQDAIESTAAIHQSTV